MEKCNVFTPLVRILFVNGADMGISSARRMADCGSWVPGRKMDLSLIVTSRGWAPTWVSNRDEEPPGKRTSSLKDTSVYVRFHVESNEEGEGRMYSRLL